MIKMKKYKEKNELTAKVNAIASKLSTELAEMNMVGILVISSVYDDKKHDKGFSGVKLLTPVTANCVFELEKITKYFYGKPFLSLIYMSDRLEACITELKKIAAIVMNKIETEHGTETVKDAQKVLQTLGIKIN